MRQLWRASDKQNQAGQEAQAVPMGDSAAVVASTAAPTNSVAQLPHAPLKQIRTTLNLQSGSLILYLVVMQLIGPAVAVAFVMILQSMRHQLVSADTALRQIDGPFAGLMNLTCVATAFVFWILTHKRQLADTSTTGIFHRAEHKMTPLVFWGAVALLFTGQSISTIYDTGFTWVTQQLHLTASTTTEAIEAASGTLAMFVYASFFGPIVEEIIFRGVIMNALKRYGKVFAIVTSAAMFGFFHSDLSQGLFAFCVGLVLGYVACEYSIFWSIVLHVFNNLIISNGLTFLLGSLSQQAQNWVNLILLLAGIVLGVLVLYLGRTSIANFIENNRSYKGIYASWGGLWFVIYLLMQVGITAMEFSPAGL
ncbi:hypothetical protein KIMH_02580 [Bombiscardovia apis]|uniref:CAAX prenyl protease 2/Lysostaphin resistance protein A-like domain-containing protein n=1 Tax=Bombiscardovia apis TaxID=2932182 RepID=A0ABM8BBA2_9BIFI|nr:CPBP family intramembrane glutamic endopeptidase [Bombiscardovia apis]BDR54147.1 hypothetical protein KIMH_02580 [Bombiscardovia apis]